MAPTILRLVLLAACAAVAGCSAPSPSVENPNQRSGASLERISPPALEAAHPVLLPAETISRILRGVVVSHDKQAERAFTEQEAATVSTTIMTALSQATPRQQVRFRILHASERQTSAGSLYVYGLSLYLTMSQYRGRPVEPGSPVELSFIPQAALRPDSYGASGKAGDSGRATLVIDYGLLVRLPNALLGPVQAETGRHEAGTGQSGNGAASEDLRKELQAVREELREIKKQMAEQEAEREKAKKKKKSP